MEGRRLLRKLPDGRIEEPTAQVLNCRVREGGARVPLEGVRRIRQQRVCFPWVWPPARRSTVITFVFRSVSLAVGSLYVQRYFKEDAKKTALEMVHDIRNEFIKILEELDWMDEKTR